MPKRLYCEKCGRELKSKIAKIRYNLDTGKKELETKYTCPKYRLFNGHTKYNTSWDGNL